jgi:hypothetical protein
MRTFIAAAALVFALGFGQTAIAADGWGNASNGYGYYHESNGAATGWGTQENGNEERFSLGGAAHERWDVSAKVQAAPVSEKRVGLNRSPRPGYGG